MIAYLATTTTRGRLLARQQHGLLPDSRWNSRRTLTRNDRARTPAGFIATRREHLQGLELTGFVLLEPVDLDLAALAAAMARRQAREPQAA